MLDQVVDFRRERQIETERETETEAGTHRERERETETERQRDRGNPGSEARRRCVSPFHVLAAPLSVCSRLGGSPTRPRDRTGT